MPTAAQPQRIALQSERCRTTRCSLQDQPLTADASFQHSLETVQIFASDARCFASQLSSLRGAALCSHPPKVPPGHCCHRHAWHSLGQRSRASAIPKAKGTLLACSKAFLLFTIFHSILQIQACAGGEASRERTRCSTFCCFSRCLQLLFSLLPDSLQPSNPLLCSHYEDISLQSKTGQETIILSCPFLDAAQSFHCCNSGLPLRAKSLD